MRSFESRKRSLRRGAVLAQKTDADIAAIRIHTDHVTGGKVRCGELDCLGCNRCRSATADRSVRSVVDQNGGKGVWCKSMMKKKIDVRNCALTLESRTHSTSVGSHGVLSLDNDTALHGDLSNLDACTPVLTKSAYGDTIEATPGLYGARYLRQLPCRQMDTLRSQSRPLLYSWICPIHERGRRTRTPMPIQSYT